MRRRHAMPFGAAVSGDGVRFGLWAPAVPAVTLLLGEDAGLALGMEPGEDGWFGLHTDRAMAGSLYRFRIGDVDVPDPASRFQPQDVHGPSQVVDPHGFAWQDGDWQGRPWHEAVFYELHVGAFSAGGEYDAVRERLPYLADLGITALQLMPLSDFPGRCNWGYSGALPFAPDSRYGRPEQLKALVQAAHACGLMIFLDVVYNHFGPEGNYLACYAPQFFSRRHQTPWGAAINYDEEGSHWVRQFFVHNALYWLEEYHLDGLRLDAVHAIVDNSMPGFLQELALAVQQGPGRQRQVHLVLENDDNRAELLQRDGSGRPRWYTAQWNDDAHHAMHVLATGEHDGYYADYAEDAAAHLGRALSEGFAYQGEPSPFRHGRHRGTASSHLPPTAFVNFLQNHDQVGNRAFGERLSMLAPPEAVRALTAVLLLAPSPPLLFMGQEWGSHRPFLFFCDFAPKLAPRVTAGRRREFASIAAFRERASDIPDPNAPQSFADSLLDWAQAVAPQGEGWQQWHRQLLAVRRQHIVPRLAGVRGAEGGFSRFGEAGLHVHWRLGDGSCLHLMANLHAGTVMPAGALPGGTLLFATHGGGMEPMPAWSARWLLEAA